MKKCTKCGIEKDENQFSKRYDKPISICKKCASIRAAKWFKENQEYSNEKRKKYYLEHKEEELRGQKEYYRKNRTEIRKKCSIRNRTPEQREKNREWARNWWKNNKEKQRENAKKFRKQNPKQSKATLYVGWAVRLGMIKKPEFCSKCNAMAKLHAHHTDYDKPLEVVWLCKICHAHAHGKLLDLLPEG